MKLVYEQENGETLLSSLLSHAGECGKNRLRCLIKDRQVRVNGNKVSDNIMLKPGDTVEAFIPEGFFSQPEIRVIYEDENIIVADKPAKTDSVRTLPRLLYKTYGEVYPAHRLDTNTTGVIMLARSETFKKALFDAFKHNLVKKTYRATVVGKMKPERGTLKGYLVKEGNKGIVNVYDEPVPGALSAVTDYEVVGENNGNSEVLLFPKTGRTHQLRVQLAHAGHPILGDGKYGDFEENRKNGARFQMLRAECLTLEGVKGILSKYSGMTFKV